VLSNDVYVTTPTPEQKMAAQQLYLDILYEAELEGVLTESEMQAYMLAHGFWSIEEETELSTASTRIDALKEEMYSSYAAFKSTQVERLRRMLTKARTRAGELFRKRHNYDIYTCDGLATIHRLQYVLARTAVDIEGHAIVDMDDFYMRQLAEQYTLSKPSDEEIRQLSKSAIWQTIWHSSKGSTGVFGVPAVNFSDEQRNLISWSRLYDNINESMEPPEKTVLEDDDLLDGWLILQYKKREAEKQKGRSGGYGQRHGGAQEVFIPAETAEDARRIEGMNSFEGKITKRQRANLVKQYGRIEEQNMPDSRQEIMMEATKAFAERMKRR